MSSNPLLQKSATYRRIVGLVSAAKRNGTGYMSTGEMCAVGLITGKPSHLPSGYNMLEAADRVGADWLEVCIQINRDGIDWAISNLKTLQAEMDAKAVAA